MPCCNIIPTGIHKNKNENENKDSVVPPSSAAAFDIAQGGQDYSVLIQRQQEVVAEFCAAPNSIQRSRMTAIHR